MKLATRPGTVAIIDENLAKAKKLFGENEYSIFSPAACYAIKKGFIAMNWLSKPTMVTMFVLVRSRGSFIEVRFDSIHSYEKLLESLRKTLWVPIHVGETIPVEEDWLKDFILDEQHAEFDTLRKNA